jgi:hypothetical protein
MKISKMIEQVKLCYKADQPFFLSGPPGVGKSDGVRQAAKELGLQFIDERMLQRDPVDVRGLPQIKDGETVWTKPDFLPTKGKGLLFLDELNAAPQLVQASCYQLINERRIGQHKLPKGWLPCAAGNRETDRAVVNRMPSALANRFVHINIDVDLEDWIGWALNNNIRTELIAFLRWRPALLFNFDPKRNERAFATPRTNEKLSRMLDVAGGDLDFEMASGITGEAHATEFLGFLRIYKNLPDPDVILMKPKEAKVPEDPATLFAVCGAIANKASEQNIGRVVEYANRLPVEFSVLLIRDCVNRDESLVQTRAFIEWSSKNSDVLI